jgi:hypothetical protein
MDCLFAETFDNESAGKLGIKRDSVILAVNQSDKQEIVQVGNDLTLQFSFKRLPNVSNGLGLLVYGIRQPNNVLKISRAFKLYPDLCPDFDSKRPTQLLMELANRFGFQITIGTFTEFFFFHQTLTIELDSGSLSSTHPNELFAKVVNVHAKVGREFTTEFLYKQNLQANELTLDCALVYTVDLDDYRKWIFQH